VLSGAPGASLALATGDGLGQYVPSWPHAPYFRRGELNRGVVYWSAPPWKARPCSRPWRRRRRPLEGGGPRAAGAASTPAADFRNHRDFCASLSYRRGPKPALLSVWAAADLARPGPLLFATTGGDETRTARGRSQGEQNCFFIGGLGNYSCGFRGGNGFRRVPRGGFLLWD